MVLLPSLVELMVVSVKAKGKTGYQNGFKYF